VTAARVASLLPEIGGLRDLCRSIAVLEAILSPDWESRYHSFGAWSEEEDLASMRNGSGDEFSIVFSAAGAYVRGFAHEAPMSPYAGEDHEPWPGVLDQVPQIFRQYVDEPAFCDDEGVPVVTACLWRQSHDTSWLVGDVDYPRTNSDPDGADELFRLLTDPSPEAFHRFAEDYYGTPVDLEVVRQVYALRPLTQQMISTLNRDVRMADLTEDVASARYPVLDGSAE
jgi:hypothetical protein